jgi:activator of HSP90 ATPase
MPRNIILAASLLATPERLFDMYLSSELHAAFTGAPVTIAPLAGALFRAFDGMISGTILHVEPKKLIVQTWRSANWPSGSIDSVLLLTFLPEPSLPDSTRGGSSLSTSTSPTKTLPASATAGRNITGHRGAPTSNVAVEPM